MDDGSSRQMDPLDQKCQKATVTFWRQDNKVLGKFVFLKNSTALFSNLDKLLSKFYS